MTRSRTPRLVLVATLVAVGLPALAGCRGWASEAPPVHLNPNMDTQHKYRPYRASAFFEDGRAMRMPIEGTVPRTLSGTEPRDADYVGADEHMYTGKTGGKDALGFPAGFVVDETTLKRGKERYDIYCAPCHAKDGSGKGTVATRLPVPPPSFHQERIHNLPLGNIFQTITHGKNPPNMPSYAHQIEVKDRWAIISYLRALMRTQKADLGLLPSADLVAKDPSELAGDPMAQAEALYKKVCIACHTLDGTKVVGPTFKGVYGRAGKDTQGNAYVVDDAFIKESIMTPNARVAEGFFPVMPPQQLSDDEMKALIEWMKTLK